MSGIRLPLGSLRRRRQANPDGSMPLREHLYELRNRLFIGLVAIGLGAVWGFMWWSTSPFGLPTLNDLLTRPYCDLPQGMRLTPTPGECQLLQTSPFEAFTIRLQVAIAAGAVLTSPAWMYQIWAFITPGLYAKERRFALTFVAIGSVLFTVGAVLAYFVVPTGLNFLVSFGEGTFITALTGKAYISFMLALLLAFGLCFELPLLVVMLNRVGILPYQKLHSWQRGIIFGIFVLASIVTPADPISMIALAVALLALFESAVLITWLHDRRMERHLAEQGLDNLDEPSRLPDPPPRFPPSATETRSRYDDDAT